MSAGTQIDFQPERAPVSAVPTSGSAPPTGAPATAPAGPRGAGTTPAPAGGGIDFQPEATQATAPLDPGGFGPYHESEAHLFAGPFDKGVYTGLSKGFGLHRADDSPVDALADTWDNLVEGAKSTFKSLRDRGIAQHGGGAGSTAVSNVVAAAGTPLMMAGQGIMGLLEAGPHGIAKIADGLQHPEPDAEGLTGRQRIGEGIGTLLSLLGQLAVSDAGGEAGDAARVGEVGKSLEKRAVNPGNALLRSKPRDFMYGHDPGAVFRDEPMHPPMELTRLGQLENVRAQIVARGEALHGQVNDLLKGADTRSAVLPNGTVRNVPNLLDPYTEIEDAATEVKRDLQNQKGVTNAKAVVKAVNDAREDMLNDRDLEGNLVKTYPRQGMIPTEVNNLKKAVGGRGKYSIFTDSDAAQIAEVKDLFYKKAYAKLNELADTAVGGNPGKRVKDLNSRYANAIEARDLIDHEINIERGTGGMNNMRRKYEWAGAAAGIASGNPIAQFLGTLEGMNRLGRSIPGRVLRAKGMAAGGRILQTPAAHAAAGAAGTVAGGIPAVSAGARRVLTGEEGGQ